VEVLDFTACSLLLFFLPQTTNARLVLGLSAHEQVFKGEPVRDSTTIVSNPIWLEQLNAPFAPLYCSPRVGRLARHQNLAALGSTLSMHG
jgi:hypothetical protein